MINRKQSEIFITGLGVTSAIGQGKAAFISALIEGRHAFGVMQRHGRQYPGASLDLEAGTEGKTAFLGAEIASFKMPDFLSKQRKRTVSFSAGVALATLSEAWNEARLYDVVPERIGLVIGGSNLQQRELMQTQEAYRDRLHFLRPSYGISFMDSDLCGLCTESFGILGFSYTLGAASASGQAAILHAAQAVQSGQVDICIALGALMDLSCWEFQAFRSLGAMGSDRYANEPSLACRPFDQNRDGFIYGESCGAVVVEGAQALLRKGVKPYARLIGWAIGMDGNRNPDPSFSGEVRVIQKALRSAGLTEDEIDYINPHGTGSRIGDDIELQAIVHCGLSHAWLNATKSITGHGLTSSGAVEIVATLLQMQEGRLHPTMNLDNPIEPSCRWVRYHATPHVIRHALNLSLGFGGINTAVCLQNVMR